MRGSDTRTGDLFSYVDLEQRVPANHPLRLIRRIVNEVLTALDSEFGRLYATEGRPSIAPERLLRALLLQAFYSIRSERQLMEQLHYNLLYRWFIGLGVDDQVWVPTVFTKNRDRLLEAAVARKFLAELLAHRDVRALLSDLWRTTVRVNRHRLGATVSAIFTASSAAIRHTALSRIRRPNSPRRAKVRRQSSPIRAMS